MQRAVFVEQVGKPLVAGDRPIPEPSNTQMLIKVHSTMLLPHDTYGRDSGLFISDKLPFILGTNIAGTIEKLGPDAAGLGFQLHEQVFGLGDLAAPKPDGSGLQQYALLNAVSTAHVPAGVSFEDVAGFPVNAVTSAVALFQPIGFGLAAPFKSGSDVASNKAKAIVVLGAGSNVGKLAVQFAALTGVGLIVAVSSVRNAEHLLKLGATQIVDRHLGDAEVVARVQKALGITEPADGALYVYDCASRSFDLALRLVPRNKDSVVVCLHPADNGVEAAAAAGIPARVQFILGNTEFLEPLTRPFFQVLAQWIGDGRLWINKYRAIDGLGDLAAIEEGLDSYAEGSAVLPVIVRPNH